MIDLRAAQGPGQRVKVGQEGSTRESQLQPNCKSKTKKGLLRAHNYNSCPPPTIYTSLFITTYIACYTAPLKNTVTTLLEYKDLDCSIRVYQSFKQVFKGAPERSERNNHPVERSARRSYFELQRIKQTNKQKSYSHHFAAQ